MSRPKIVIVGNGMAGSRVAEEIRLQDSNRMLDLTIIGAEPGHAYNRILLSELLAGRQRRESISLQHDTWHDDNGVRLIPGVQAASLDREGRQVLLSDGSIVDFDIAVLATGSAAVLPPISGMATESGLVRGAYSFRTLADCDSIDRAAKTASRAIVLGGGLLGIEAARGLAGRGMPVVIVHMASHLMERQLDSEGGRVLGRTLKNLGVEVRLNAAATGVITTPEGTVEGLALADGSCVLGDLLVVAAGVRPDVSLAREAGLQTGSGIVVDDTMRSVTDQRIFAIGDCAQHRDSVYGLVAPAWEQARICASQITGTSPDSRYRGSRVITRLKASGIDLASIGDPFASGEHLDVVQVSDPRRGTYARVILDGDRIVGGIVLGDVAGLATLSTLYDRNAALPADRLSLLMPIDALAASPSRAATPSSMPASAVVCKCNGVTKATIQGSVLKGARTVEAVATATRATTGCGGCADAVCGIVDWLNASEPDPAVPESAIS